MWRSNVVAPRGVREARPPALDLAGMEHLIHRTFRLLLAVFEHQNGKPLLADLHEDGAGRFGGIDRQPRWLEAVVVEPELNSEGVLVKERLVNDGGEMRAGDSPDLKPLVVLAPQPARVRSVRRVLLPEIQQLLGTAKLLSALPVPEPVLVSDRHSAAPPVSPVARFLYVGRFTWATPSIGDTGRGKSGTRKRSWVLDIDGPLCVYEGDASLSIPFDPAPVKRHTVACGWRILGRDAESFRPDAGRRRPRCSSEGAERRRRAPGRDPGRSGGGGMGGLRPGADREPGRHARRGRAHRRAGRERGRRGGSRGRPRSGLRRGDRRGDRELRIERRVRVAREADGVDRARTAGRSGST